jgi:hypothetical protein
MAHQGGLTGAVASMPRKKKILLFSGVGPTHQSHTERVCGLGWLGWLSGPVCWVAVLFLPLSLFFVHIIFSIFYFTDLDSNLNSNLFCRTYILEFYLKST